MFENLFTVEFCYWLNAEITGHWRHGLQVIRGSVPEHEIACLPVNYWGNVTICFTEI